MTATLAPVTFESSFTLDGVQLLYRVEGGPVSVDSDGVEWILTRLDGWSGRPKPRTVRTAKPFGIGSYRSQSYPESRTIGVEFEVTAPTDAIARVVEQQLGAWCSDGGQLYELTVIDPPLEPLTALVELDDAILTHYVTPVSLLVSAAFAAPDPRKWSAEWMDRTSVMATPSLDGVEYDTPGADYSGFGIDYGIGGFPSTAQLANYGTAPSGPFFAIYGPSSRPMVTDLVSGWSVSYAGDLASGDVLTINCDEFSQRDQGSHTALINGSTNVWSRIVRSGDWPSIDPQSVATYQLTAAALSPASLVASVRSAWW